MFGDLFKAVVNVVEAPISLAADVITLGGALTDRDEPYTASTLSNLVKNLENAGKPDSK